MHSLSRATSPHQQDATGGHSAYCAVCASRRSQSSSIASSQLWSQVTKERSPARSVSPRSQRQHQQQHQQQHPQLEAGPIAADLLASLLAASNSSNNNNNANTISSLATRLTALEATVNSLVAELGQEKEERVRLAQENASQLTENKRLHEQLAAIFREVEASSKSIVISAIPNHQEYGSSGSRGGGGRPAETFSSSSTSSSSSSPSSSSSSPASGTGRRNQQDFVQRYPESGDTIDTMAMRSFAQETARLRSMAASQQTQRAVFHNTNMYNNNNNNDYNNNNSNFYDY